MTYQEAAAEKAANHGDVHKVKETPYRVFVVPRKADDFLKYLAKAQLNFKDLTDEFSIPFSSDDRFGVCGLSRDVKGVSGTRSV